MILRFPYQEEPLQGPPPPSLPKSAQSRWRPLVPVTVHGPVGTSVSLGRALVDPGADDTILPFDLATLLGVPFLTATGHALRWRGQRFILRFGVIELELVAMSVTPFVGPQPLDSLRQTCTILCLGFAVVWNTWMRGFLVKIG